MDEKIFEFKRQLKKLKEFKGSGTELISVYIPAGSPLHDTSAKLRPEMNQASNIKSKSTRTNVLGALEKIIQHFKIYRKTPKNGLAVFAGNISDNPAKTDIQLFALEPPQPLSVGTYRCDNKFFLEPLERMVESQDQYGLLVMDGRDATLAVVKGTYIQVLKKLHSTAHQKVSKGGQSQRRFQRLVEEQIEYYYKRVSKAMDNCFLPRKVKGVIVGGPGPSKHNLLKMKAFNYQLKILGVVDTGYTDEYGLREVLSKSEDVLAKQEAIQEKTIIDRFIKEAVSDGLATYGEKQVRAVILSGQAEKVLLSEDLAYKRVSYTCTCGNTQEKTMKESSPSISCTKCKGEMKKHEEKNLLDDLIDLAKQQNIEVVLISTNSTEGAQFLTGFAGVGAFLRYKI